MDNLIDNHLDRKLSAASADDGAMYEITPFGRRRKSNRGRAAFDWLLHIVGLPFVYVYELMRNRPSEASYATAPKPPEAKQAMTPEKQQ